jgi:hypothetical protein
MDSLSPAAKRRTRTQVGILPHGDPGAKRRLSMMGHTPDTESVPARNAGEYVSPSLPRDLLQAITAAESRPAACEEVVRLAAKSGPVRAAVLLQRAEGDTLSITAEYVCDPALKLCADLRQTA